MSIARSEMKTDVGVYERRSLLELSSIDCIVTLISPSTSNWARWLK